jgi:SPP1 gp7 family putative phage head morphogenesis protein
MKPATTPAKPSPLAVGLVPFEEAIESARARKIVLPETYYGVLQGIERAEAFSVAGIAALDQLQQTIDSLTRAMQEGETFADWKLRMLKAPDVLALPKHRLDNIFRTNIQGAYARGRCVHIERNKHIRPFLMYSAINDDRTRPAHHAMNGHVAPVGDAIWKTWTPPCGYRCRCTVISLTPDQAKGKQAADKARLDASAEAAMARAQAVAGGPDKGWDYSPCEHMDEGTTRAASEKRRRYSEALKAQLDGTMKQARAIRGAEDPDYWKPISGRKGSNDGGLFEAPDGTQHYVKFYADPDQARGELAAQRINAMLGLETPKVRIIKIDGKTALASEWRADFVRLGLKELHDPKYQEDIATIFQASVLTKNWDVVGAGYDNIVLSPKTGRLVVIDTGASFKHRAQGALKAGGFTADIAEAKTLRDAKLNPEAHAVFQRHFDADVFAERDAAAKVLPAITKAKVQRAFEEAGYKASDIALLTDTMMARKAALVDRYDLDGKWGIPGTERMIATFRKKWGSAALADSAARADPEQGMRIHDALRYTMESFSKWLDGNVYAKASVSARRVFNDNWSDTSSSDAAAMVKLWAVDRFKGVKVGFQSGFIGSAATQEAKVAAGRNIKAARRTEAELYSMLDAEWAFQQYMLRRVHGWDEIKIQRGMDYAEFEAAFKPSAKKAFPEIGDDGVFTGNGVYSTTTRVNVFGSRPRRVEITTRIENVLKTWFQGVHFMGCGFRESEYIAIGRPVAARMIK